MVQNRSQLQGKKILLGVTGGIAAYKAVDLASKLTAAGASVAAVMTQNACEFVQPLCFEAVTCGQVFTSMWKTPEDYKIGHIKAADWLDMLVVAPATANIIAKTAAGICDDLLSTTICTCWQKPMLFAPAMNNRMWQNPVVAANVEKIKCAGINIIGPESGRLACGDTSIGRMSEPAKIIEKLEQMAAQAY